MKGLNVSLLISFLAGLATFVSPCLLPLVPAYISFVTGRSLQQLQDQPRTWRADFLPGFFFVLGFAIVFTALGASLTLLGGLLVRQKNLLRMVGGLIVILFGLHLAGVFKIPWLYQEKRLRLRRVFQGHPGSLLLGAIFALGWTPCVGPILGSILILASTETTSGRGILLLVVYSFGLGIPFLLTALFINRALHFFLRIRRFYRLIEIVSGLILIVTGFLIITNRLVTLW